jgi:FixJ family two-component response regulator
MGTSHATKYIYVVDDDQSFGSSLKRLLEAKGIAAEHFASAQAFLDAVPSDKENAIAIIDLHMPECNGLQLIERMQDAGYHMPVIVITGQAQPNTEDIVLKLGAIGFLQKPFSDQSLFELIKAQK